MASRRFIQLKSELRRLRKHFLPKQWNPTGSYNNKVFDQTRAYKILAHAEIESFIEEILLELVERKYNAWTNERRPNYCIIRLIIGSLLDWNVTDDEEVIDYNPFKIKKEMEDPIINLVNKARNNYKTLIENNNGIKSINLKKLLVPVGIPLTQLDNTWLNNLDSFGRIRGDYAHKSRLGISRMPDPKNELEAIEVLLVGLLSLDEMVKTEKNYRF